MGLSELEDSDESSNGGGFRGVQMAGTRRKLGVAGVLVSEAILTVVSTDNEFLYNLWLLY